jgi:transcriptional activator SPT8
MVRSFGEHGSQISSLASRPLHPVAPMDVDQAPSKPSQDEHLMLSSSMDGQCFVWDKRQCTPVRKLSPEKCPPWCLSACWSTDGQRIYAGRRNGTGKYTTMVSFAY